MQGEKYESIAFQRQQQRTRLHLYRSFGSGEDFKRRRCRNGNPANRSGARCGLHRVQSLRQDQPLRVSKRLRKRLDRKGKDCGRIYFRHARLLCASERAHSVRAGQNVLRGARLLRAQACGGSRFRPQGRHDGVFRRAEQISVNFADADSLLHLLEHSARKFTGRDEKGRRRHADHEKSRKKHGLAHQMYRSGQKSGLGRSAERKKPREPILSDKKRQKE